MTERVGAKIQRLREGRGWSRAVLHLASGISEATIYRVESGRQPPRPTTVNALLDALSRPSEAIDGQKAGDAARGGLRIEDHLSALIGHIKTLEGEARSKFIRAVTSLLDALEHPSPRAGSGTTPNDDRG